MGRALIVTWDGGGNVPPMLRIGRELADRGHELLVIGHERQREEIAQVGIDFTPYRRGRPFSRLVERDPLSVFELFTDGEAGRDVSDVLSDSPADVVLVDCLMLGPLQAAEAAGVPTVGLFHTFYGFFAGGLQESPITSIGAAVGRLPRPLWDAANEMLVGTDRILDPHSGPTPPNVHWTGVPQPAPRSVGSPDSGRILLSLSTVWFPGQEESLQTILDAVAELPVTVVATVGENIERTRLRIPSNVEFTGYVDHSDVMAEVSIVIGHGGHATTMLALAHDLPLLIVPQFPIDQPVVGEVVEASGAGLTLSQEASVDQIADAITTLMHHDSYRNAAAAIGARLRAKDGAAAAADRIEALIASSVDAQLRVG